MSKIGLDDFLIKHDVEELKNLPCHIVKPLSDRVAEATQDNYKPLLKEIAKVTDAIDRDLLLKALSKKLNIRVELLRQVVDRDINTKETNQPVADNDKIVISKAEEEEALTLLNDDNFWMKYLDITEYLGYVGEEENKITLYLGMTSRKSDDPISATVKGDSSAGKSFAVQETSRFMPEEDILEFTTMTPKALFYRKDSLKHKILIIYERPGAEESDYSIRTLQSEKKLVISVPMKNPQTGNFETQDIEVEGPVAYIETTTKSRIHAENETRCFDIHIDESEEQTRKIHQAQNRKHEIAALDKENILKPWKNVQRLLKSYPIFISFADKIRFPTRPLRVRRDRPRFLALIEASALLFQHKRNKTIINSKEFIVADIEDYTVAYGLIVKILESVLKGLSPKVKELIEIAKEFDGSDFTRKDLQKKVTWNEKTVENNVNEAVTWGYFDITQEGGKGKAYRYKLIKTDDTPIGLLTPEELAEELKKKIPSIPSNPQSGGGDFKPASALGKRLNPHIHQQEVKERGI